MGEMDLIQVIALPAIMAIVSGLKKLMDLTGVSRDLIAPVVSAMLGIVYMYFRSTGAIPGGADVDPGGDFIGTVVGGTKLGALASVAWKVFRPVLGRVFK